MNEHKFDIKKLDKLNNPERLNLIDIDENTADLVFMITVHHELKNPVDLLKDAKRVLKSNGKLLICDWKENAHKHFVTKDSLISDLKIAGFSNIKEINTSDKLISLIVNN